MIYEIKENQNTNRKVRYRIIKSLTHTDQGSIDWYKVNTVNFQR